MSADLPWLLGVVLAAAAVLAAAKAHGRQVRLERERAGFDEVDFMADNPPFVEHLWERDRRIYWPAFAVAGLAVGAFRVATRGWALEVALDSLAAALLAGFFVAGLASVRRFALAQESARPPEWVRAAWRGSAAWWSLAVLLALSWVAFGVAR